MKKLTVEQANLVGKAFKEHGKLVAQVARKYAGKNVDKGDLESYLNEKFIEAVLRYDSTKGCTLGAYLNSRLGQHALNFIKSAYAQQRQATTPFSRFEEVNGEGEGEEGGLDHLDILKDTETDTAEQAVKNEAVSTAIKALCEGATELQKRIMDVYLKAEVKPTYTQVGKAVGVHHETVKRELKKLAKLTNFDVSILD